MLDKSFDPNLAAKFGVMNAIVYREFEMLETVPDQGDNIRKTGSRTWHYCGHNYLLNWMFPFLTEKKIKSALKAVERLGWIEFQWEKDTGSMWFSITERL